MASKKFPKFARPETPISGPITDRDLDLLAAILCYRFFPSGSSRPARWRQ